MDANKSVTYHITKTGNILRQLVTKRLKEGEVNLTPEEATLMNQLWDDDEQTVSELGQWSIKDPSTLTRQIDGLVKKGYVERFHGVKDRRNVFVKLTAEGKKLKKQFHKTAIQHLDEHLAHLSAQELETTIQLLLDIQNRALAELQDQ